MQIHRPFTQVIKKDTFCEDESIDLDLGDSGKKQNDKKPPF